MAQRSLVNHDCPVYPGLTPVLKVTDEHDRPHQLQAAHAYPGQQQPGAVKMVLERSGALPTAADLPDRRSYSRKEITPLILDGTIASRNPRTYALYFPSKCSKS